MYRDSDAVTLPPSYDENDDSSSSGQTTIQIAAPPPSAPSTSSSTTLAQDNILLTWDDGDEIQGSEEAVRALNNAQTQPSSPATPTTAPPRSPSPEERPPEYAQAQRPTKNVRYSFSPIGHNAMVLLPPSDAQDTRPRYYITVAMNCFQPLSHITTIFSGSNESGVVVSEFEMGIIDATNHVQIRNKSRPIGQLLSKYGSRVNGMWTWEIPRTRGQSQTTPNKIRWDYSSRPCICTGPTHSKTYARFTPHIGPSLRDPQSTLEVTPEGHDIFDDILTSLLIIERKRLLPSSNSVLKPLFN